MTDYCDNCNKVIPRDSTICAYRGVVCCSENCMREAPRTIAARNALALALWPDDEDDDRPTGAVVIEFVAHSAPTQYRVTTARTTKATARTP